VSRPLTIDVLVERRGLAADAPWTQRITLGGQWRACPIEAWMLPAGEDAEIPDLARTVIHADDERWFTHETHDEIVQRTGATTPSSRTLAQLAAAVTQAKAAPVVRPTIVIDEAHTLDVWQCAMCTGVVAHLHGRRIPHEPMSPFDRACDCPDGPTRHPAIRIATVAT
jgi:hypothetical protein